MQHLADLAGSAVSGRFQTLAGLGLLAWADFGVPAWLAAAWELGGGGGNMSRASFVGFCSLHVLEFLYFLQFFVVHFLLVGVQFFALPAGVYLLPEQRGLMVVAATARVRNRQRGNQ